ncbi:hypothetical protein ERJ75_000800400 [Trypanosoma vivax]|nr:hypothetical protein ERJ75_000800400 [Trypanosoma vivax]
MCAGAIAERRRQRGMMATWLNVAEKPSVAKEIANVLSNGNGRNSETLSRFYPVFEFEFEGQRLLCTSEAVPLMNYDFPAQTKNWSSFPLLNLFTVGITKHVKPELEQVKRNLESL